MPHISHALGITMPCIVKRAHQLGPPSNDRGIPRPVIVRYLNYSDRVNILKSFRNSKSLQLDGHKLLLFAGYSPEISLKRKAFQPIRAALYQKGVKFTMAYPPILRFTDPSGDSKSLPHPEEAQQYMQAYLHILIDTLAPSTPSHLATPRDQHSPSKDLAKKCCLSDSSGCNKTH